VPAFNIFWCISCMAFMRESIAAVDPAPPMAMGAMRLPGGEAAGVPGLAQAAARVAADKTMRVRMASMLNSWLSYWRWLAGKLRGRADWGFGVRGSGPASEFDRMDAEG
jgi:hypothetical protein